MTPTDGTPTQQDDVWAAAPTRVPTADPAAIALDASKRAKAAKKRRNRRPVKRATIVTHRWLSFVLGTVLLVITTSGAAVVFAPEWTRWTNSAAFDVQPTNQSISFTKAMAIVDAAHPKFKAGTVNVYSGLYEVQSSDSAAHPGFYGVEPGTGRITGYVNPQRGVMAFMTQVHECFFTCENYPGYVPFLNKPVPTLGMHWLKDVTWSGLILGIAALLLIFLGVSGIWLWWPGIKRFSHGFRVRTTKGRYARDYDLHQVVGMAAIPFLLVWGLTGASFEFHWVNTAWYAVTGGEQEPETSFASHKVASTTAPDIGLDAATAVANIQAGPGAKLVYATLPAAGDATAYYDFWYSRTFDQYAHGGYPGQFEVSVDRHDATHLAVNDYGTAPTLSNKVLDRLGAATFHYGQSFNGWWRIFWFVFGLTPLLLAATGISTWLAKRSVRKRRKQAQAAHAAADAATSTTSATSASTTPATSASTSTSAAP